MQAARGIILAFDLGTTNLKAALFDEAGNMLAISRRSPPVTDVTGRIELTLDAFQSSLVALVNDLSAVQDLSSIRGVSFASQANSFALLDQENRAITPIVLWTDARATGIDQPLNRIPDLHESSGIPSVDHEFAPSKLRWFAINEPTITRRVRKISFISDILVEWMTGLHEAEIGLACLTALATRKSATWAEERIAQLGLPQLKWPRIRRAGAMVGLILPEVAGRLGLPLSARLFMGCLDQYAGAIGTGTVSPGNVCETTGTVLATVQCVGADSPPPGPNVFEGPSFSPGKLFRMTFSSTSANLLEWYRSNCQADRSFESLIELAENCSTAIDVPRVSSRVADAFSAIDLTGAAGPIVNGIMRRVCEELNTLIGELGASGQPIRSAGGGARSDVWLQMKADRIGVTVSAASTQEPTCLGAAMLAANGLGLGSIEELAKRWCRPRKSFVPTKG